MTRLIVLLFSLFLFGVVPASAGELVDQIVAVVNKDIILQSELDEAVDYAGSTELRGLEGEELEKALAEVRAVLLDSLIATRLMEQAMDRADVRVSDRELEASIADIAKRRQRQRLYKVIFYSPSYTTNTSRDLQDFIKCKILTTVNKLNRRYLLRCPCSSCPNIYSYWLRTSQCASLRRCIGKGNVLVSCCSSANSSSNYIAVTFS